MPSDNAHREESPLLETEQPRTRRQVLRGAAGLAAVRAMAGPLEAEASGGSQAPRETGAALSSPATRAAGNGPQLEAMAAPWKRDRDWGIPLDFAARWIWHDAPRTPAGAFCFFRREFELEDFRAAEAWVSGNARYQLFVNGTLVSRGPAPCDPRQWDVDWVDLEPLLQRGKNVFAAIVLSYGYGDGTYVPSTPLGEGASAGFLLEARIESPTGEVRILSDDSWKSRRATCWKPQPKRWYLKALTEVFDARLWPAGWQSAGFDDSRWKNARPLAIPPGRPIASPPGGSWPDDWRLVARSIPPLRETRRLAARPAESALLPLGSLAQWEEPLENDCVVADPEAVRIQLTTSPVASPNANGEIFPLPLTLRSEDPQRGGDLVDFAFPEIVCGYPHISLDAPAGTVVDLVWSEARHPRGPFVNPSAFLNWAQFTCVEGRNTFTAWEWESLRFLTVMVRAPQGATLSIAEVGVLERSYAWGKQTALECPDEAIQRVVEATLRTHRVTCQDVIVDNVARERQQYAGDVDHAKLTSYYAFGDTAQARRMLETYQMGQNEEGWFLDCWPAWDRTQRLWQKHLGLTNWGPILDHGVEFVISAAKYGLFSGDLDTVRTVYQRGMRLGDFLWAHRDGDGLIPSDRWRWNSVWIDHDGYRHQANKRAAWTCYVVGLFDEGIAQMAAWFGDTAVAEEGKRRAKALRDAVRRVFWDERRKLIVDDVSSLARGATPHVHERTLAMALLYGVIPPAETGEAVRLLAGFPMDRNEKYMQPEGFDFPVGFGFPPNHCWRYWALAKFGRGDVVVRELRERWGRLPSIAQAGTLGETWEPSPESPRSIWCQNGSPPLYALFGDVLGVRPTAPGWAEYQVRPQLGSLRSLASTIPTTRGPLAVAVASAADGGSAGGYELRISPLRDTTWRLLLPAGSTVEGLPPNARESAATEPASRAWQMPGGGGELRVRWK